MLSNNLGIHGDFTPVLAEHARSFSLVDAGRD
jgi:hypothetical protein